jgi:hypothetical protein
MKSLELNETVLTKSYNELRTLVKSFGVNLGANPKKEELISYIKKLMQKDCGKVSLRNLTVGDKFRFLNSKKIYEIVEDCLESVGNFKIKSDGIVRFTKMVDLNVVKVTE